MTICINNAALSVLFRIVLIIAAFISNNGCDVPGVITMKNLSEKKVVFKYYYQENNSKDTLEFYLSPKKEGNNEATILFGFGQFWTDERIKMYVDGIIRIEITTDNTMVMINSRDEMIEFFKKRRQGIFKNRIKIIRVVSA
jgi:hypothetical protein